MASVNQLKALGWDVRMSPWSRKANEAVSQQWEPKGRKFPWVWLDIVDHYREPDAFTVAIWTPSDRLVGLSLTTLSKTAATVRYLECDPDQTCEFRGKRAFFCLNTVTNYAQITGRTEIRIEPVNQALASFYESVFGFTLASKGVPRPYYWLKV